METNFDAVMISDFTLDDPIAGGSEFVDNTIASTLKIKIEKSRNWIPRNDKFIILSNISTMSQENVDYIANNCNYIIVEHDYKIHSTRHPWRFKDSIVPLEERINYPLYRNAKAVFTQTDDHLSVFKANEVPGNFISLKSSVWSEKELNVLALNSCKERATTKFAIVESSNWIKNTRGAIDFCVSNKIDFELVSNSKHDAFLKQLSNYPALVFFPIARETCCRLIVEAKCMGMNIITTPNSGAFQSDWFNLSGYKLRELLSENSKNNIEAIKSYL